MSKDMNKEEKIITNWIDTIIELISNIVYLEWPGDIDKIAQALKERCASTKLDVWIEQQVAELKGR